MAKQVPWNKIIVERFIELAMLEGTLSEKILRMRVAGWTIRRQALEFNVSESTVHRIVADLKKIYDNVQKYDPVLPKRKASKTELYMDEN